PSLFSARLATPRPDVVPLSELLVRSSTGVPDPVSLSPRGRCEHRFRCPTTRSPHGGFSGPCIQRPNAKLRPVTHVYLGRFRPVFSAAKVPRILGRQALHPLPRPAGGVVISEPFGIDRRGPKHTRAEQVEN